MGIRVLKQGFTIVELLIVIVVIGILVTITVVAYTGMQNKAYDAAIQSDLHGMQNKLEIWKTLNGGYPINNVDLLTSIVDIKVSKASYAQSPATTNNLVYCYDADDRPRIYYVLALSKSGSGFYISSSEPGIHNLPISWKGDVGGDVEMCYEMDDTLDPVHNAFRGYAANDEATGPWRAWVGGN